MMFDSNNGNKNWKDAELLKPKHFYNFDSFNYLGPNTSTCIPPGHNKIQVHLINDYKQYGRYKSRNVASGNRTGPNLKTNYSIIISFSSRRTIFYLVEWNNIKRHTGDISNT